MKLITILFCLSMLISAGMAAETKVPLDRVNWSQSLPLNANITLDGGEVVGQTFATQYDTVVRQDGTYVYAMYGKNKTSIDAGTIGSTVNSRVIRSAINATPTNGSLYIDRGLYSLTCDLNCTPGSPSYPIYYWTALPVTNDIRIFGAGMGATVLQMAPAQYSTTRPALIIYDYCPYSESGGDGVGPGHQMFSLEDLTFDGDIDNQTAPCYHDGAGLYLSGSPRWNARIRNVEFKRSPNHALYMGYNGGGWESRAVLENIYTHDNYGSSQIDNSEDTVIDHWVSEGDGYGMWTAGHWALVLDGMMSTSGHLIADNIHIRDGALFIFGYQRLRDDVSMRVSNLYIDSSAVAQSGVYIGNCNNVTISDGKIVAGTANYAVSVDNSSNVYLDDLELRGMRGLITWSGEFSDIRADGCIFNTSEDCFRTYTPSHAVFAGCDFYTSSAAGYLVNVGTGSSAVISGSVGAGAGLVHVGGTLTHSGTAGLGLEAYGSSSVADGGTISHTMKITPRYVQVTPSVAGTIATVTAISSTTFTVDFSGTTTTQTVYWHAFY